MNRFLMLLALTASAAAADGLGERVLWNGLSRGAKWDTATGLTAVSDGDSLTARTTADYGWATTAEAFPVTEATRIDLDVKRVNNGTFKAQIEWFREDGTFLSATEIKPAAASLTSLLPAGERPGKFRFKFWLEGKDAEVSLSKARITAALAWRKAGTKLVATYDAQSKITADAGMKLDGLAMRLETEYSAFVFEDNVRYDAKGTVLVDVAGIKDGALTVQALCWSADGVFQKAVDLVRDMTTAGYTEVPLAMHQEEFPADVAKLSFKVWLSGREANARLAALRYGVQP